MKAAVLVKNGDPRKAFQIREMPDPPVGPDEVCVNATTFGLNFADVMARLGLYQDCPSLPTVIGYEAVGTVASFGANVKGFEIGQRVVIFSRFGGYATKVVSPATGVFPIADNITDAEATALATQYCTAYYAAAYITQLHEGDHVLVQSAAGGVGTALVQLAKHKKCVIYGTAGSEKKIAHIKKQGVHHAINYRTSEFDEVIKKTAPNGKVDVIFDAIGGSSVRKGMKLLDSGGRMVAYGAASMSGRRNQVFNSLKGVVGFGLYHPVKFLMNSISFLGVNMLRIADNKPQIIQHTGLAVAQLAAEGVFKPVVGGEFSIAQLAEAHEFLEFRKSIGKVVVHW